MGLFTGRWKGDQKGGKQRICGSGKSVRGGKGKGKFCFYLWWPAEKNKCKMFSYHCLQGKQKRAAGESVAMWLILICARFPLKTPPGPWHVILQSGGGPAVVGKVLAEVLKAISFGTAGKPKKKISFLGMSVNWKNRGEGVPYHFIGHTGFGLGDNHPRNP